MGIVQNAKNNLQSFFNKKIENTPKLKGAMSQLTKQHGGSPSSFLLSYTYLSNFYYSYVGSSENDMFSKMVDFSSMYRDPIIFNALELIIDDTTSYSNSTKKKVWSVSEDQTIQEEIETMFNESNIQEMISDIATRVALYGNCPVRIYYNDDYTGISYLELEENINRYIPIEINGVLIKWFDRYSSTLLEPYEVKWFKINSLLDFQVLDNYYNINMQGTQKDISKNTFRYGTSLFENVRRLWKQLKLLEDNMILSRMSRAAIIRLFKLSVGDADPQTIEEYIAWYAKLLSVERTTSINDDMLSDNNGQMNIDTNIILPVNDQQSLEHDELGGNVDVNGIVDIDYFKQKFYAALKVPPSFLGMSEDLPGAIGEGSLIRIEIRYARMIKKFQYVLMKGLKDVCFYHLLCKHPDMEYEKFDVVMNVVSTAEEEETKNALTSSVESMTNFMTLIDNVKELVKSGDVSKEGVGELIQYLSDKILNVQDFDWEKFTADLLRDTQIESPEEEVPGVPGEEGTQPDASGSEVPPEIAALAGEPGEIGSEEPKKKPIERPVTLTPRPDKSAKPYRGPSNNPKPKTSSNPRPLLLQSLPKAFMYKLQKLDYNIPKFSYDKGLKYVKESQVSKTGSPKRYIVEKVAKKYDLNQLQDLSQKSSGFDIGVLGLQYENAKLDVIGSDVVTIKEKEKETVDIKNIIFTETVFNFADIMEAKGTDKITIYKKEGKYYSNYTNALKLFNKVITKEDYKKGMEILELKDKIKSKIL